MRVALWSILTLSALLPPTRSMPFTPRNDFWQSSRRRLVDTPAAQAFAPNPEPFGRSVGKNQKRVFNYSIVQVDGSSTAGSGSTIVQTVTRPASSALPSTKTVILTSVLPDIKSQEIAVITTTEEIVQSTATRPAVVTVTISQDDVPPPPTIETNQVVSTSTYLSVETVTSTPTSTTQYYDDGLWHTFYPIKTFIPDWSTSATTTSSYSTVRSAFSSPVHVRAAAGTAHAPYPVAAGAAYPTNNAWHRRQEARVNMEPRGTSLVGPSDASRQQHSRSSISEIEERRVPADLKVASWNITKA